MTKKTPEEVSKYFSEIAKKRHRENPKPKEYYSMIGKKSGEARRKKKDK